MFCLVALHHDQQTRFYPDCPWSHPSSHLRMELLTTGTDISRSLVAVRRKFSFPIDFSAGTTRSLLLHLVPSLPILATSLSASTRVRISLNWSSPLLYWLTLSLLGAPLGLIRSEGRLINSCILSQAHGILHAPSQVHLMSSNFHRIRNRLRRSTLPTCSHIHRN